MLPIARPAVLAAVAAASGAALYGAAAGGVAAVDDDLRSVTPLVRFERVDSRGARAPDAESPGQLCPDRIRRLDGRDEV